MNSMNFKMCNIDEILDIHFHDISHKYFYTTDV